MRTRILVSTLLLVAFVGTGCVSKARYQDQESETVYQKKRVQKLERTVDKLRQEMATLIDQEVLNDDQVRELKSTISQLNRRIDGLKASQRRIGRKSRKKTNEIRTLNQQIQSLNEIEASIKEALESEERDNRRLETQVDRLQRVRRNLDEETRRLENRLVNLRRATRTFLLPDKIYFQPGSATLNREQKTGLDALTSKLRRHPDRLIAVEGHADTEEIQESPFSSNWDLSAKRATSVVEYLTANSDLNHHRFVVMGRGEYEPERNLFRGEAGRNLDRRVLISFVPRPESVSLEE